MDPSGPFAWECYGNSQNWRKTWQIAVIRLSFLPPMFFTVRPVTSGDFIDIKYTLCSELAIYGLCNQLMEPA